MVSKVARVAKAAIAGVGAASAAAVTAAQDGVVTNLEWLTILGALAAVAWATWRVPNRQDAPPRG